MDIYGIKTLQNGIGLFCTKMTVSQLAQIGVVLPSAWRMRRLSR